MLTLYEKIGALCSNKHINITEMCTNAGVSRGSLTDLKMGRKKTLAAETLSRIADYFGVSIEYLMGKLDQREKTLYEKIDLLCTENSVTITEMCKRSGVNRGSLTDLKQGRIKSLSADTITKISSYFNVTVDHFLGSEQKEKPVAPKGSELQDVYFNFAKNAQDNGIDPQDIDAAIDMIKRLRNK